MRHLFHRSALTVPALLLMAMCCHAQTDAPSTRDTLTDSSGRVFTRRQIMHMGARRFEDAWNGRYRDAINIYTEIVEEDNSRRLKSIHGVRRARIVLMDEALGKVDASTGMVCSELNGGGLAVTMDSMLLHADGQKTMRAMYIKRSRLSSASSRREYRAATNALFRWIHSHRHFYAVNQNKMYNGSPVIHAHFQRELAALEVEAMQLDSLMAKLPDAYCGPAADHIRLATKTLDKWIMKS